MYGPYPEGCGLFAAVKAICAKCPKSTEEMEKEQFLYGIKKKLSTIQKPEKAEKVTYTRSYAQNPHIADPPVSAKKAENKNICFVYN